MKEKWQSFTKRCTDFLDKYGLQYSKTVMKITAVIYAACLLLSLLFHKSFGILSLLLAAVSVFWYAIVINYVPEDLRALVKTWLKVDLYMAVSCIGFVPYCFLSKLMGRASAATMFVGAMGVATMVLCLVVFSCSETGKKTWTLLDKGIKSGSTGNQDLKQGDVVLCDSKARVEEKAKDCREIILYKDRFLHMLIIGTTGSGKTSQIILPMCYQDVHNLEAGVTVLEPKGDLAREVAMMAEEMGRPYLYFDPSVDNCPFFNPLIGDETDVIENAVTTFLSLNPDSPQYFKDLSEQLVRNVLKVLKRLDKDKGIDGYYSTFIWMSRVLQNNGGQGRELVQKFANIRSATPDEAKENADIASWFLNEYFAERSKVYENSSGIRSQVSKVIANRYLRRVLNPSVENGEYNQIDFDKHLADGGVICISTAQGLMRDLSNFLGYFLILQFKSAVFRRPGNEDNRRAHFLYIDEFQQYATPGFSEMLTQGRSYRVACHLATQARVQMAMGGGRDGKYFVDLVSTNARNVVVLPGGSSEDAKFYSAEFGEQEKEEVAYSKTRKTFNLLTGGLSSLGHPSESERISTKMTATFSASDLIYRPFGEIVYRIIKNGSVQQPQVGLVKWLPKEYDSKLKQMIEDIIVTHEISHADATPTTPADTNADFMWDDDNTDESVDFTPEQEPDDGQPTAQEEAAMFEDAPKDDSMADDMAWIQEEPIIEDHYEHELKIDDGHGDPFTDDLI